MARLTYKLIERISHLRQSRMDWRGIASIIGVHENTLYLWRKRGEAEESGVYYELVESLARADAELYEKATQVLFKEAFEGYTSTSEKVVTDEYGNILKTETKTEKVAPNSNLALKIAERLYPEIWQPTHRVQVDWKSTAKAKGIDPNKLEENFKTFVETTGLPEITAEESEDADS